MSVEGFYDQQKDMVRRLFEVELIENTKLYPINTPKPRNVSVEDYIARVETINDCIPFVDISAVKYTDRELIRSVIMQKVPGGLCSSLLRAWNNNITSIEALTAKLVSIETADNEEQKEKVTHLTRRISPSRNGILSIDKAMTEELDLGGKIMKEAEAVTIIERTISKVDLLVVEITALIHLKSERTKEKYSWWNQIYFSFLQRNNTIHTMMIVYCHQVGNVTVMLSNRAKKVRFQEIAKATTLKEEHSLIINRSLPWLSNRIKKGKIEKSEHLWNFRSQIQKVYIYDIWDCWTSAAPIISSAKNWWSNMI